MSTRHFFYARDGKRYMRFKHQASRDAWVAVAPNWREALPSEKVSTRLKYRGDDFTTGETIEDGPELASK